MHGQLGFMAYTIHCCYLTLYMLGKSIALWRCVIAWKAVLLSQGELNMQESPCQRGVTKHEAGNNNACFCASCIF